MTRSVAAAAIAAFLALTNAAFAQAPANPPPAEAARLAAIVEGQHRLGGDVPLPGADATLHLGDKFYFLGPAETRQVLKEWGYPPPVGDSLLGMVLPAGQAFTQSTWGALVRYAPVGHIDDAGADKVDYSRMPDLVRQGEAAANHLRESDYLPAVHMVGWVQSPSYDKVRHVLVWARDLKFEGERDDKLSYDIRLLGRRGFLSLNLVSTMPHLAVVRAAATDLAAAATFNPGSAYDDFTAASDKRAGFGVSLLVTSGLGLVVVKLDAMDTFAVFAQKLLLPVLLVFALLGVWIRHRFARKRPPPAAA